MTYQINVGWLKIVLICLQKLDPISGAIERRVDSTRVDADEIIDELVKDFHIDDNAEGSEGVLIFHYYNILGLYIIYFKRYDKYHNKRWSNIRYVSTIHLVWF